MIFVSERYVLGLQLKLNQIFLKTQSRLMSLTAPPTELTRHGIKKLCESSSIDKDFKDVNMVFQVLTVDIFDD